MMESYRSGQALGLGFGIVIGLVLAALALRLINKNHRIKTEYDEMQQAIRSRGYKYAFYAVLIVEALLCITATAFTLPAEPLVIHFIPIFVGVAVQGVYCIWKGAYVGLNTNMKRYGLLCAACILLNLFPFAMAWREGSLIADGRLQSPFVNLLCVILLAVLGAAALLRRAAERGVEE